MNVPLSVEVDVVEEMPLPAGAEPDELAQLVRHVLQIEQQIGSWAVTVALVSDEALRTMHRDFMGIETETDVMTFPLEIGPWGESQGGDIVISVERAADQAPEFDLSTWDEIRFLVAHGTLHLCGWDDTNDDDRARMLAHQRELIDAFDRDNR